MACLTLAFASLMPSDAMAQAYLAQLSFLEKFAINLYERGDVDQAKKEFQRILRINPKSETAKKYLAHIDDGGMPSTAKSRTALDKANAIASDIQALKKDLAQNEREVSLLESIIRNLITENDQIYMALNKRSREVMELREKVYGLSRASQQKKMARELPPDRVPQNLHRADDVLPAAYTASAGKEINAVANRLGKATEDLHAITSDIEESKRDLQALAAKAAQEKEKEAYKDLLDAKRNALIEKSMVLAEKKDKLNALKTDVTSINQNLKSAHYRYAELIEKIDNYYKDIKDTLAANYAADEKMFNDLVADYAKQTKELESLKQSMQKEVGSAEKAAQKRYDDLMARYKAVNSELDTLKHNAETASLATQAAEKAVAEKTAAEIAAQKRYDELMAQYKTMSDEVDELKQNAAAANEGKQRYDELLAQYQAQDEELTTLKQTMKNEAAAGKNAVEDAKAATAAAISAAQKRYDELMAQYKVKANELETYKRNTYGTGARTEKAAAATMATSPEEMQKRYDELMAQYKAKANELATLKINERSKAVDQKKLNDLLASCESKENELANLRKNIVQRDAELATFKAPLLEAEAKIKSLESGLAAKDQEIAEFRAQINYAHNAFSTLDAQLQNIQELMLAGDADMAKLSQGITKMKTLALSRKNSQRLTKEAEKKLAALQASLSEKDSNIKGLQQQLADNAKKISELQRHLDAKAEDILMLEAASNRKDEAARQLRADLQEQSKKASDLKQPDPELIDALSKEQDKLRATLIQRDQQLLETAKDLAETKAEIARLILTLEDANKQLGEEAKNRQTKEKELAQLASLIETQKNQQDQNLAAAKEDAEKSRLAVQSKELDIKERELAFTESKAALKKLSGALVEAQGQVQVLEDRLAFLEDKQQNMRAVSDKRDAELAKLNAELADSRTDLQSAQKKIAALTAKNKDAEAAVARAVIKLQDSALKNAQTTQQIEKMRADLKAAHQAIKDLHKDVNDVARYKGTLDKREAIINDLQKDLQQQCTTIYYEEGEAKAAGCTIKKSTSDQPASE